MAISASVSAFGNVELNILITIIIWCLLSTTDNYGIGAAGRQQLALISKMEAIGQTSCSNYGELRGSVQHCGNSTMRVTYPFWIRSTTNCTSNGRNIWMEDFQLECKQASGKVYLKGEVTVDDPAEIEVVEIKNDNTLVVDVSNLRREVFNCPTKPRLKIFFSTLSLKPYPGPLVMASDNMLLSWGCATGVIYTGDLKSGANQDYIADRDYSDYTGLYIKTSCSIVHKDVSNSMCNGSTCCTVPFPPLSSSSSTRYAWFASYAGLQYSLDNPACNANASCNSRNPPFVSLFNPEFSDVLRNVFRIRILWAIPWNFSIESSDYDHNLANRHEEEIKSLIRRSAEYACDPDHANLTLVPYVPGYICSCNKGFTGDGYINGLGCVDVDECINPSLNDCIPGRSTCHNLQGSYMCKCNSWRQTGDATINGTGCQASTALVKALAVIGGMLGLLLLCGAIITQLVIRHRKITRRKHFAQHGGLQLEAYIASQGGANTRKLFTEKELKVATNNYSNDMKLGSGGFGTVFKGILADGTVVAIKKAHKKSWDAQGNDFVNEMLILMQVNHKYIVRLLGCCIETEVPLLVYEYVSNGTLAARLRIRRLKNVDNERDENSLQFGSGIHSVTKRLYPDQNSPQSGSGVHSVNKWLYPIKKDVNQRPESELTILHVSLSWKQRLKVAIQIAEALAYLHEAISPPIVHMDVKPQNVLLDDMYDAKVADFGLSRLVMAAQQEKGEEMGLHHQSTKKVQGTLGYIDPEYFQTLQFTSKSDVYSFGVLLLELITGLKVIDQTRESEFTYLVKLFLHHMQQGTLHFIIDACLLLKNDDMKRDDQKQHEVIDDACSDAATKLTLSSYPSSIMGTAKLASHCLNPVGSIRPSMRDVVEELMHIDKTSCSTRHFDSLLSNNNSSPSTFGYQSQSPSDAHSLYNHIGLSSSYSVRSNGQVSELVLTSPR